MRTSSSGAIVLLVLAAALHFVGLSEPRRVVFDEVHFGGFVNAYVGSGRFFHDIHPPHAKLLVAGAVALGGYRGDQSFQDLNEPITKLSPALLRLVPALAGTLLPVLFFVLLGQLGASPAAAFLGGWAVLLDNALLVQTRILALDGLLLLGIFGSLSLFLAARRAAGRPRRTLLALGAGALAGLAVGTKFTGLAAVGLIGVCLAVDVLRPRDRLSLRSAASLVIWLSAGFLVVYAAGWVMHFRLLTEPGSGFAFGAPSGELLRDVVDVHRAMLASNYGLTASHPYASPWWSWPLMLRPVFYWSDPTRQLFFVGNPVLWWGSTLALVLVLATGVLLRVSDLELPAVADVAPHRLWIPLVGYAIAFGPLIRVPRPLFLYHYLTPLLFGLCVAILGLDRLGWTRNAGWRAQRASYFAALVALVVGFVILSPLSLAWIEAPSLRTLIFDTFPGWR